MIRFLAMLGLLLLGAAQVRGATVIGSLQDTSGNPINLPIKFAPDGLPSISGENLLVGVTKTITPSNGTFSVDLVSGIYKVTVASHPSFKIFVPVGAITYNINDLATGLVLAASSMGSKVSEDDQTVGFLSEKLVAGTNIVLEVINDGGAEQFRINSTATGSGDGTLTSVGLDVPDILTVTGSPLTADGVITIGVTDPGADAGVMWRDASGKLVFWTAAPGLTFSGATLSVDIAGLPTLASPNGAVDYVMVHDTDTGNLTKLLMNNIPGLRSLTLALPNIFNVSGSPASANVSTITATLATQAPNAVFAGPTTGSPATPAFRALVAADIPAHDAAKITTGQFPIERLATGTPDGTKFLRDDGVLAVPPGGGGTGTPGGPESSIQVHVAGELSGSSLFTIADNRLTATNLTVRNNFIIESTGGAGHYLKQSILGAGVSSGVIAPEDIPAAVDASKLANGNVSNAEYQYLDGVTSAIQTQIDAKLTPPADPDVDGFIGWHNGDSAFKIFPPVAPLQITGGTNLGLNLGVELEVVSGQLRWKNGQPLAVDYFTNIYYSVYTHSTGLTNLDAGVTGIYAKSDGHLYLTNTALGEKVVSRKPFKQGFFFSDRTTPITAGTGKARIRLPCAVTLTEVRASLTTAQASGNIFTVDINEGVTSILSTKITIDNTEKSSKDATTPPVISDTSLADDAEITVDVDQIGNGTAVEGMVWLIGWES